jgi:hypothetical protein
MGIVNEEVPNYDHYHVEDEIRKLREAMVRLGLRVDETFYQNIKVGDIIEIYKFPENTQIHCNDEFIRLCSYTPEQMQSAPLPKMFWRDNEIHMALTKRAAYVTTSENGAVPWELPNHELIESLHPRKRTFEMKMGWIAPCYDIHTGERRAWASTLQVSLIFEWDEDLTV